MRRYLRVTAVFTVFLLAVWVRNSLEEPQDLPPGVGHATVANPKPTVLPTVIPIATATVTVLLPDPTATPPPPSATTGPVSTATVQPATENAVPSATPARTPALEPTPGPAHTTWPTFFTGSAFKDGEFSGRSDRMYYGYLTVDIVMHGGRIEGARIVEYPDRTPTSVRMSMEILPGLIEQAVAKQDWDVDIVSGATQTCVAFQRAMVYALRASENG